MESHLGRINPEVFQAIWRKAREEQPEITRRAIYERINNVRKEYSKTISPRTAANVLASRMDIDVYKIVKDKNELNELRDLPSRVLLRDVLKQTLPQVLSKKRKPVSRKPPRKIFIVHGRDNKALEELRKMLCRFGLKPIILREQPSGSNTIIEQLEKCAKDVEFALILLTPDDILFPASKKGSGYIPDSDKPIFRTRQNVVLEFGYFISKIGRKNVRCLWKGITELPFDVPSDMHGIVYLQFRDTVREIKHDIAKQLTKWGFTLKTSKRKGR